MRSTSARSTLMSAGVIVLRHAAADELVEHGAQLVDLVGFLDRDLAHEDAAVLLQADEPGLLERPECLAHGAPRHAEAARRSRLVELGAGGKLARQDHALELALHQAGERMRAQHLDRAFGGGAAAVPAARRGCGAPWRAIPLAVAPDRIRGLQHVAIRRGGV